MQNRLQRLIITSFLLTGAILPDLVAQTLDCHLDEDFVVLGCSGGRDCIPALTNPKLLEAGEAYYLRDDELILGVYRKGVARAYPHRLLWWHEVVNDTVGGEMVTVTFCPLTGTGLLFDATLNGQERAFGVSGLLYNSNLIIYDRTSGETLFPQMCYSGQVSQGGKLVSTGDQLTLLPIIETTWAAWKELHPKTTVLDDDTGTEFNYSHYPYGDYRTNDDFLLYAVSREDPRLPRKERILGLNLNGIPRAYSFKTMEETAVLNDEIDGSKVLILFSKKARLAVAYFRDVEEQVLNFDLILERDPEISGEGLFRIRDKETGTNWNMKGKAVSGPLRGTRLEQIPAHNAMWFAWATFWDNPEIADIEAIITSAERSEPEQNSGPIDFVLHQNFPNPFNPTTTVVYELEVNSIVTLKIYDVLGHEVRTLVGGRRQSSGRKTVSWDGRDSRGQMVSSGIYIYEIQAGQSVKSRKMLLLR